jgi:hypothetical protein
MDTAEKSEQTKLTLRLEDRLIARAKTWARAHDTSLSDMVAGFFAQLPEANARDGDGDLSPWTRSLVGAGRLRGQPAPADDTLRDEYVDYLERKYA